MDEYETGQTLDIEVGYNGLGQKDKVPKSCQLMVVMGRRVERGLILLYILLWKYDLVSVSIIYSHRILIQIFMYFSVKNNGKYRTFLLMKTNQFVITVIYLISTIRINKIIFLCKQIQNIRFRNSNKIVYFGPEQ